MGPGLQDQKRHAFSGLPLCGTGGLVGAEIRSMTLRFFFGCAGRVCAEFSRAMRAVLNLRSICRLHGLFCCMFSISLITECSSIHSGYYLRAPTDSVITSCAIGSDESVECARISFEGMNLLFWAGTPTHPTMRGPCLIPIIPEDQPILDTYDLRLHMRILDAGKLNADVSLLSDSLAALSPAGVQKPRGITEYNFHQGVDSILEYYGADSSWPRAFKINSDRTYEIWLPGIIYAQTDHFDFSPAFLIRGEIKKMPAIRFEPALRRQYTPYYFPFTYAPVR